MILGLLSNWRLLFSIGVGLAVFGYVWHCQHVKAELAAAAAIAEQQLRQNEAKAQRDITNKERSDENYERNIARLRADLQRLRDTRPSLLPAPAPGTESPDRISFDRAELDAALRRYRVGVLEVVGEGAAAVEGLDESKAWARGAHD